MMRTNDLQVQAALVAAGHGHREIDCRGAMHATLSQLLQEDAEGNEDLVDRLRSLLSEADVLDSLAEWDQVKLEHAGLKACPERGCGCRPDVFYSGDQVFIACLNHADGAVMQGGKSLSDAISRWNEVDFSVPGQARKLFPF